MRELRCRGNKLHGLVVDEERPASGTIEFRCGSHFCGAEPGKVILHRYDLESGTYTTRQYSEPPKLRKDTQHGSGN